MSYNYVIIKGVNIHYICYTCVINDSVISYNFIEPLVTLAQGSHCKFPGFSKAFPN